jgi:hypothetical protein
LFGNNAGIAGPRADLTPAQARTLLNVANGANAYIHPNHSGDVTSVADGATSLMWRHDLLNACWNASFESGDFGWTKQSGWTIENDSANARTGNWVAKNTSTSGSFDLRGQNFASVRPGDKIYAEAWLKSSAAAVYSIARVYVWWYDKDLVFLSAATGNNFNTEQPSYVLSSVEGTAPANAAYYITGFQLTKTAGTIWVDDFHSCRLRSATKLLSDASISLSKLGGDITTAGKALLDDADAPAQRTTLGLGTAATQASTDFATAAHTHSGLAPTGGASGEVLKKNSAADFDYAWAADATGGGGGGSIANANGTLTVDVALPVTGTWYDGPSVSLAAGTWFVTAHVTLMRTATTALQYFARITDGTSHVASANQYAVSATNNAINISMSAIVTVAMTATFKIQATTTVGAASNLMKAEIQVNGSGNNATQINAIKLA